MVRICEISEVINNGGTLEFRSVHFEDSGFVVNAISSPLPTLGTKFLITLHCKIATTDSSDDGIIEVWIDTVKVVDDQAVDNNPQTTNRIFMGGVSASTSAP